MHRVQGWASVVLLSHSLTDSLETWTFTEFGAHGISARLANQEAPATLSAFTELRL